MSWSERYVQDHRRRTDCGVHRACAQLASDPPTFETFQELLTCSRKRAPCLFEAPVFDGRHPGIDALVNLSRFRAAHIRPVIEWAGTSSSWRLAVSSMAHHLVCDYKVPLFVASAWYATDSAADKKRGWFVAHSRGELSIARTAGRDDPKDGTYLPGIAGSSTHRTSYAQSGVAQSRCAGWVRGGNHVYSIGHRLAS